MRYSFLGKIKKTQPWLFSILILAICLIPIQTSAADFDWSGFGSMGGGRTFDKDETFLADPVTNTTYDDSFSFDADSCIGLQTNVDLMDKLSAAIQIIGRGGSRFDAEFEYAFLEYAFTNAFSFVFGKKRAPLSMHSQNLEVGYTYHWIRLPNEIYSISTTHVTGLGMRFRDSFKNIAIDVDIYYGASSALEATASKAFAQEILVDSEDISGITAQVSSGNIKFHTSYQNAKSELSSAALGTLADIPSDLYTLGMVFDIGRLFIHTEISQHYLRKFTNSYLAYYGSLGFRIASFTPHITYGRYEQDDNNISATAEGESTTIGLRYDFHPSAAVKIEYAKIKDESDPEALLPFSDSDSITIAVDFIF